MSAPSDYEPPPDTEHMRGMSIQETHHHHHSNGNGANARLNSIILGVAGFALAALWGVAVWMIQDMRAEIRGTTAAVQGIDKRLVKVETKLEQQP